MSDDDIEYLAVVNSTAKFYISHSKDKNPRGYSHTEIEQQGQSIIIKQNNTIIRYLALISQKLDKVLDKFKDIGKDIDPKVVKELDDITKKLGELHVTPTTEKLIKPKRPEWQFFQVGAKPYPKQ